MGIRLIIYLDNLLVLHQSMEEVAQLTSLICQLFEALGLVEEIHTDAIPESGVLGLRVNTVSLQLIFPAEKLRKIQQLA